MIGDRNFAAEAKGLYCTTHGKWTGGTDKQNQNDWSRHVQKTSGMHELFQPHCTHENALARSRLDRVYTNHFTSEQLDRQFTCTALPWNRLSAHRPISFSRFSPEERTRRCIPQGPIGHPDWARRVALEYHERLAEDTLSDNAVRRLVVVKRAISTVTKHMHREHIVAEAAGTDDKLGWTMAYIRAIESIKLSRMSQCAKAYPYLASLVDPLNPNARIDPGMVRLRSHAVELARGGITEKLSRLRGMNADDPNN
jgi:hypothetical protein